MTSGKRRKVILGILATAAVGYLSAVATVNAPAAPGAPDDEMPYAVENFDYPGADHILATRGIKLKRGDGHIVLADCEQAANQIRVYAVKDTSAGRDGLYCFRTTAAAGYLSLELPRVFALEAGEHPISADLTANGETQTVAVPQDGFKSVGEGTVDGAQSVLVEIRVTG